MSEENNKKTCSMYALADALLPRQPWYPSTDEVAEQIADLIVEHRYTVRYDTVMKPLIDVAVLRDPAAFAIARANYPGWTFETFIERFLKDVVERMNIRTKRRN